eukprot:gnl/MRDRNA2_/MRDRNA2_28488_c0_seq1.p1 gnl/MRDRNA2_/MRDRNA2_28488_c0~~gnl/MRDRNA2_/MRDRNA2_28488_c0_seq1.p1  ORF type:complete len:681 (-),score=154.32 gnl/MRDRNA2_/MRDRNA2_28488_c0_seq1:221-2263(-)
MRNTIVIILFDLVVHAHEKEFAEGHDSNGKDAMDKLVDDLVANLVERTRKVWPVHQANLDNATLAKAYPSASHGLSYSRSSLPVSRSALPIPRSHFSLAHSTMPMLHSHSLAISHSHGGRNIRSTSSNAMENYGNEDSSAAADTDDAAEQSTSGERFAAAAIAAAAMAAGAAAVLPGKAERSRKPKRSTTMKKSTGPGTALPEVDRATTREFRRGLMRSDQYHRFGKTQMDNAMEQLKSISGSNLLRKIRESGFTYTIGDVTFKLAESYGFCWGVERSVAMAYEARNHFADKDIWVTNEIIHNPDVNRKLTELGMRFIEKGEDGEKDFSVVGQGDVVILPAFGATVNEMAFLKDKQVNIVDTTCPWVTKVWNSVEKNKDQGHTSIIHGTYSHEETVATSSFADKYLVVRDMAEAEYVAEYILNGGDRDEFLTRFKDRMSPGFDPDKDLKKVGVANQTTMLKGETELIGKLFERTMIRRFGPQEINDHFKSFNTICDATDERQDAMYKMFGKEYEPAPSKLYDELEASQRGIELLTDKDTNQLSSAAKEAESRGAAGTPVAIQGPVDMVLVVGGFNSANTAHLLEIVQEQGIPGYHIDGSERIGAPGEDLSTQTLTNQIESKPMCTKAADAVQGKGLDITQGFLPDGPITIGVTSGASTPDNIVEECLKRILAVRGLQSLA